MLFMCVVFVIILLCVLLKHLHVIWQIRSINNQIEFMNTHQTNKIVSGEYGSSCITSLINNGNSLSKQCSILKAECMTNEDSIKETITNISHDIRTPLTSLSGYFQLMCQSDTLEEQKEYSRIIKQQISILEEMLEELFTYAKLSSKSYEMPLTKCHINQILRDTVFSFYNDFKNANITPEITISEKPIYIWANDIALKRIFQNVLKNVIEHGEKSIGVFMQQNDNEIEITFCNSILPDAEIDVARIFERFYKCDAVRSSSSTGLGLSIAKELLSKMNSSISASINNNLFEITIIFKIDSSKEYDSNANNRARCTYAEPMNL